MILQRKHFDILVALASSEEALSQRDLEKITEIKTVTLIPVLRYVKGFEGTDNAFIELPLETRTPQPKTADGVWMGGKLERTEFPQYALTFTLG